MCSLRPLCISLALPVVVLLATPLIAALGPADPAHAESLHAFALDGAGEQTLAGDTLTVTLASQIADGVGFGATLTVVGSADLTQTASGLGVAGGSSPLNDGESLSFSLAFHDVQGGAVSFSGFTGVELKFFSTDGEEAVFSTDADLGSADDNFLVATTAGGGSVSLAAHRPLAFTLFGYDNGGTTSFRVDAITASVAATRAAPEPLPLLLLAPVLLVTAVRHRRAAAQG